MYIIYEFVIVENVDFCITKDRKRVIISIRLSLLYTPFFLLEKETLHFTQFSGNAVVVVLKSYWLPVLAVASWGFPNLI